jgi:hypothetical protein
LWTIGEYVRVVPKSLILPLRCGSGRRHDPRPMEPIECHCLCPMWHGGIVCETVTRPFRSDSQRERNAKAAADRLGEPICVSCAISLVRRMHWNAYHRRANRVRKAAYANPLPMGPFRR